jgi:hypothetical protein
MLAGALHSTQYIETSLTPIQALLQSSDIGRNSQQFWFSAAACAGISPSSEPRFCKIAALVTLGIINHERSGDKVSSCDCIA